MCSATHKLIEIVHFLEKRLRGRSLTVNNNNEVLVLVKEHLIKTLSACVAISTEYKVQVYRPNGRLVLSFGQGILKDTLDITATADCSVMVCKENLVFTCSTPTEATFTSLK